MKRVALIAALMVIAACGDAGGSSEPTADGPAAVTVEDNGGEQPSGPGQVEIAVDGVTGGSTQILLTVVHQGNPGRPLGAACAAIDDDPWTFAGMVYSIEGNEPCALGTTPVELQPGTYDAFFGVYTGGQQSPDQCVEVQFEVAGDTTVTATELAAPCDLYN